jgi:mono/diheme cytochrome c family protein
MKRHFALLVLLAAVPLAIADPFPKGDPNIGRTLVEKACSVCHSSLFGGDPNQIYLRPERKVKNARDLLTQVRAFSMNSGAGWSPTDQEHAAAYLNQAFYKFP